VKAWQHLKADNDPDGNPQRLYVVYELQTGEYADNLGSFQWWRIVGVYDEGYAGMPSSLKSLPEIPSVRISKSDYHSRYTMAKGAGLLRYGS